MYCCSARENKMDYKRRFLLGGSKQKVQQHQQYPMPELGRTLSAPMASTAAVTPPLTPTTQIADIQQGISKYLDALNVFCRASTLLTDLFSSVFRNSHYSKAAMQLKDVQVHVMEAASRLTAAIKPEIAKMLMELSAGTANFKDQNDFSLQDIEVLGRCFLTVLQVHFQFLSQALHRVQPIIHSCLAEAQAQERKNAVGSETMKAGRVTELEEAVKSWGGASEATSRLREEGSDGSLAGIEVQQLFCSQTTTIPEHQLKDLNMKIDSALQAYKVALEGLGHCEYAMKAGFHLNPKAIESSLQGCCSEAEVKQAGRKQYPAQPLQCELPTVPVQIGPHFLKGISFSESGAENLKLKMQAMVQLIKEAAGQNEVSPRDESPTEILNQVCPSTWRGACKTAVQLLFGQAGLVVVDTAQIENKEAYAPQISLEGSRILVQVPSTWCLKEDPATMSLLQRCLDPEKTLGLVDVLYTAVFDLCRWKEKREQVLPSIQIQLRRECTDFGTHVDLPTANGAIVKSSGGLQKTFAKLTSRFTKRNSCSSSTSNSSSSGGSFSIPNTPSKSNFSINSSEEERKAKLPNHSDLRLQSILNVGSFPKTVDSQEVSRSTSNPMVNGFSVDKREIFFKGDEGKDDQGIKLPSDQEMQDVIDFLSGFNMGKSQKASPLTNRRNSVTAPERKAATLQQPQTVPHTPLPNSHQVAQRQHQHQQQQQQLQYYQHLLQPIGQQPPPARPQTPRGPGKWPNSTSQQTSQSPGSGLSPIGSMSQWSNIAVHSDLSSDLYSLGLVGNYMDNIMDNVMSDMLGPKVANTRNNTWPNRVQSDGVFGMLGDILPFDPAVGSDPEFARYVAGVSQAMQQKRQVQHVRRHSTARTNWPITDEPHRTWQPSECFTEGDMLSWSGTQGDSASSSDEASSANGDSLFSMFSGPDLVAAVKPRSRKHSSGDQETSTLPSPPVLPAPDDFGQFLTQDNKTKTWPPKAPWQHSTSLTNTMPNPGTSLYQIVNPVSQWNDSMQILQSPVWSTASGNSASTAISSSFSFTQQQQQQPQQQQVSQHKTMNKGFKSYPVKQERRQSYLHQY
ncbi:granule associated Rac and RHOG effector protein 1-like isoform X1 [Stegostoma tigrinum]|uniref:granule associated Rac and RHOG effector protein 1-like isoform X1 n=2 Tax=Stegostoma tigrinum TaxID=3053191 RepID=UPI00287061B2|nr:granule associated Rac and RHOG effector protein 1-like isoform X1 [Stegostoma tigrinum]